MKTFIPLQIMALRVALLVFYSDNFGMNITHKSRCAIKKTKN